MSRMPKQRPHLSEQVVQTPSLFLDLLKHKLGVDRFTIDLAASDGNSVADVYFTENEDALVQNWYAGQGWAFCNPPYGDIEPWVSKAYMESRNHDAYVAMLVPASVGSNWWKNYVDGKALVLFLNGRLTFVGHSAPYPKDCAILLYAPYLNGGYNIWSWQNE